MENQNLPLIAETDHLLTSFRVKLSAYHHKKEIEQFMINFKNRDLLKLDFIIAYKEKIYPNVTCFIDSIELYHATADYQISFTPFNKVVEFPI